MKETYDTFEFYCRMLGHPVPFRYCRTVNEELPCRNIVQCWSAHMPVDEFISREYTATERERIFAPPPSKLATIVSIIQKARDNS